MSLESVGFRENIWRRFLKHVTDSREENYRWSVLRPEVLPPTLVGIKFIDYRFDREYEGIEAYTIQLWSTDKITPRDEPSPLKREVAADSYIPGFIEAHSGSDKWVAAQEVEVETLLNDIDAIKQAENLVPRYPV
jgi:hypothetical protein